MYWVRVRFPYPLGLEFSTGQSRISKYSRSPFLSGISILTGCVNKKIQVPVGGRLWPGYLPCELNERPVAKVRLNHPNCLSVAVFLGVWRTTVPYPVNHQNVLFGSLC